jgi:hypothetical protein
MEIFENPNQAQQEVGSLEKQNQENLFGFTEKTPDDIQNDLLRQVDFEDLSLDTLETVKVFAGIIYEVRSDVLGLFDQSKLSIEEWQDVPESHELKRVTNKKLDELRVGLANYTKERSEFMIYALESDLKGANSRKTAEILSGSENASQIMNLQQQKVDTAVDLTPEGRVNYKALYENLSLQFKYQEEIEAKMEKVDISAKTPEQLAVMVKQAGYRSVLDMMILQNLKSDKTRAKVEARFIENAALVMKIQRQNPLSEAEVPKIKHNDVFLNIPEDLQKEIDYEVKQIKEGKKDHIYGARILSDFIENGGMSPDMQVLELVNQGFGSGDGIKAFQQRISKYEGKADLVDMINDGDLEEIAMHSLIREAQELLCSNMGLKDLNDLQKYTNSMLGFSDGFSVIDTEGADYIYENAGKISGKFSVSNFALGRGVDAGIMIFAFNFMAALKTDNWDNEYLLIAPAIVYGSVKAIHENWIDNAINPKNKAFNIANRLNYTASGRETMDCFRDEQEMAVLKMIDWNTLRKNSKAFDIKDDSADSYQKWQEEKLSTFPLINPDMREVFEQMVAELPRDNMTQRFEFLNFIYRDSKFVNTAFTEAVRQHILKMPKQ